MMKLFRSQAGPAAAVLLARLPPPTLRGGLHTGDDDGRHGDDPGNPQYRHGHRGQIRAGARTIFFRVTP